MKLQNSNKVYRFKGSDETDFKRNSYIVYQEHGHNYVYGRFEPVKNLFSGYERIVNHISEKKGHERVPNMEAMLYLPDGSYQTYKTIDLSDWEESDYYFVANVDPMVRAAKKKDKSVMTHEVVWSAERIILLIGVIALCIVLLFFAYAIFYD